MKERLQTRVKDLQKKQKKGFTLIELIVVLVILGIILALTVPAVTSYIDDANDAKYMANGRAVFIAAEVERTKDIAKDPTVANQKWPKADGSSDTTKDTTISDKSTVEVTDVKYADGVYTFTLTDGDKTITVDPNKDIKVAD